MPLSKETYEALVLTAKEEERNKFPEYPDDSDVMAMAGFMLLLQVRFMHSETISTETKTAVSTAIEMIRSGVYGNLSSNN